MRTVAAYSEDNEIFRKPYKPSIEKLCTIDGAAPRMEALVRPFLLLTAAFEATSSADTNSYARIGNRSVVSWA
jgi:hypothetical protein